VNEQELDKLEQRLDALIAVCQRLKNENRALKVHQKKLGEMHARLNEKTQLARARIEAMIDRLKTLERG
jgi:cell division protein ZapB